MCNTWKNALNLDRRGAGVSRAPGTLLDFLQYAGNVFFFRERLFGAFKNAADSGFLN